MAKKLREIKILNLVISLYLKLDLDNPLSIQVLIAQI